MTYVYYQYDRIYNPEKKYSVPQCTSIGKCCEGPQTHMYPNENYVKFFPELALSELKGISNRLGYIKLGTYIVLEKLEKECKLDSALGAILGDDTGPFLDLAAYTIISENNAAQYYPDYALEHLLFTPDMRVYSDSKISDFLASMQRDSSVKFLNAWNASRDHREKVYISYDSTNKNCQAGNIEIAEFGHAKDDQSKPIVNYSIAYDKLNQTPLYYKAYAGSVTDVSQLRYMLNKAVGYGCNKAAFILDRGFFSRENIRFMDQNGYDFVIMVKGMKSLVRNLVQEVKGNFEEDRSCSIRSYQVSGTTVRHQLSPSDEQKQYFHIYYNTQKMPVKGNILNSGLISWPGIINLVKARRFG